VPVTCSGNDKVVRLRERYACALKEYLTRGDEAGLQRAYELGRRGLADGVGLLDITAAHHAALARELHRRGGAAESARTVAAAHDFFAECLSPFEMTHRTFRDSAIALRNLYEGVEAEVKRIAHALHDEAGQLLASVYLALRELEADLTPDARLGIERIHSLLAQVEKELRRVSHELRPTVLDDLGLVPALQYLANSVSLRTGLSVAVECDEGPPLPLVVETTVYRIVQESLTNAIKHARASQVAIGLSRGAKALRCVIRDNGRGFDVPSVLARRGAERGLGLAGILERVAALGGALHIGSAAGAGTQLDLTIPLETCDAAQRAAGR
jgi:two-component system sensor histidine kinase UhpB